MRARWVKRVLLVGTLFVFTLIGVTPGCSPHGTTAPPAPLAEMPTGLSQKIDAAGAALVPDIPGSSSSSLSIPSQPAALTYGTTDQWNPYTQPNTLFLLTDIFGPAEGGLGPVQRIRVVLYLFRLIVDDITSADPQFTCRPSGFGAVPFNGGDTVEIAFYGQIPNGSAGDRLFDCVREETDSNADESWTLAYLWGLSSGGRVSVVTQQDVVATNTEKIAARGSQLRGRHLVWAIYQEQKEGDSTVAYLDIQYNSGTSYIGPDGIFSTADDLFNKSRTRITGRVVFDSSNNATEATGDFAVIHSGSDEGKLGSGLRLTTKTLGRGSYDTGDDFLFRIENEGITEVANSAGFFCLEATDPNAGGVPLYIDSSNCSGLETSFAWGTAEFPFDLPPLERVFENRLFFQEADLINDDGSNFTIPNY